MPSWQGGLLVVTTEYSGGYSDGYWGYLEGGGVSFACSSPAGGMLFGVSGLLLLLLLFGLFHWLFHTKSTK